MKSGCVFLQAVGTGDARGQNMMTTDEIHCFPSIFIMRTAGSDNGVNQLRKITTETMIPSQEGLGAEETRNGHDGNSGLPRAMPGCPGFGLQSNIHGMVRLRKLFLKDRAKLRHMSETAGG